MSKRRNNLTANESPLRYPGGKSRIAGFVADMIVQSGIQSPIYIEPFAGGAGVALSLLYAGVVDEIVINDYDKAIYSVWRAILTETKKFIKLIEKTPVTIEEWRKQKAVYTNQNKKYSLELGFATFFLNRTNRSGVLNAGPIGGFDQKGNYKIDVRFNKLRLIEKIKRIASYKQKIHLYNHDVRTFATAFLPKYLDRAFIYFDPPYYQKGECLYKNFFNSRDHQEIHDIIVGINAPWIVTYDNVDAIKQLYAAQTGWLFNITYSVANSGKNAEVIYVSDVRLLDNNKHASRLGLQQLH